MPSVKRSNPVSAASPTKKKCLVIEEAIRCAEGAGLASLTSSAAATLTAAVPFSLGLVKGERHKFQEEAVSMTGQVLEDYKANLESGLQRCRLAVTEAESRRDELQAAAQQKQSASDDAQGIANKFKMALAGDARTFQAAKVQLKEAERLAEEGGKELKSAADRKKEVEKLQQEMAQLHEDQSGRQIKDFVARAQLYVDADSSMMTAIPCVLAKDPSARGQFDLMVVQQLTEKVDKAITKFQIIIENGAAAEAERAAAVEAAKATLQQAQQKQIEAARAFTEASNAAKRAEEVVQKTKTEIAQAKKALKNTSQMADTAQFDFDLFCQEVLQTFADLKNREAVAEVSDAATSLELNASPPCVITEPVVIEVAA